METGIAAVVAAAVDAAVVTAAAVAAEEELESVVEFEADVIGEAEQEVE